MCFYNTEISCANKLRNVLWEHEISCACWLETRRAKVMFSENKQRKSVHELGRGGARQLISSRQRCLFQPPRARGRDGRLGVKNPFCQEKGFWSWDGTGGRTGQGTDGTGRGPGQDGTGQDGTGLARFVPNWRHACMQNKPYKTRPPILAFRDIGTPNVRNVRIGDPVL